LILNPNLKKYKLFFKNIIFNSFVKAIRCMWFNNNSTDEFCHKTVRSIANENSAFCLRSQHVFQIIFLTIYF